MKNTQLSAAPTTSLENEVLDSAELTESEKKEYLKFCCDFDEKLKELGGALAKTNSVKTLAEGLKTKGAMKNLWGSFSGSNDKELAGMVEDLGCSLETTQLILQLFMEVQNIKNKYLRAFHKALVNKVAKIEVDTVTLDSNQQKVAIDNQHKVAIVMSKLRDQIAEQIEQQTIVENHQQKLLQLDGYVAQKDVLDQEQSEKISSLETRAQQIIRTDEEHQRLIEELKASHASKDELDRIQTQRIDTLSTAIIDLEVDSEKHQRMISLLENQQSLLIQQLRALDTAYREQTSTRAVVLRNLLPGIALLVGLLGLLASIW